MRIKIVVHVSTVNYMQKNCAYWSLLTSNNVLIFVLAISFHLNSLLTAKNINHLFELI